MADTLGGSNIAVKPQFRREPRPGWITTLVTEWQGRKSGCFFRTVADRSPESLSDFLKRWNQLGNINANHCAFAQPALDIELKIRSVEHAQPLPHVAQPDSFYVNVRQFFFRDAHTVIFNLDAEPAIAPNGTQFDLSAADFRRQAVLQAIFDNRLKQHAGDKRFHRRIVNVLHDIQV